MDFACDSKINVLTNKECGVSTSTGKPGNQEKSVNFFQSGKRKVICKLESQGILGRSEKSHGKTISENI